MKKVLLVCILTIFIAVNFCGCEKRNNDNILDSELEIKEKNININDSTMNIENSKDVNDSEVSIEISEDIVKNIENITSNLDGEVTEIIWAFPNHSFEMATESVEKRINNKLEEDGYKFRLKCMFIDLDGYEDNIIDCDADIVYTGLKADTESLSSAYLAIKEGKYKCLDDFLESSNLYDFFPEILWESVRMDGKIYCIPNVALPDSGLAIVLKKERYSKQDIDSFDNTLEGLSRLLSSDDILGYGISDCSYMDMYNIPNNSLWISYENEKMSNLMENEVNIEWLEFLHSLAQDNRLVKTDLDEFEGLKEPQWDIGLLYTGEAMQLDDDKYWKIFYKGDSRDHFLGSIAIRENAHNAKYAFQMIELFLTNSEYANCIIYGDDYVEKDGFALDADTGQKKYSFISKLYWGINCGTLKGEGDYYCFASSGEMKKYYDTYIRYESSGWMENREFAAGIYKMANKYQDIVFKKNTFETQLSKWIEESKEVFDLID